MAMNVSSAEEGEEQFNNTINTTPLVDVMLVLLIIFLITIPVVTTSIPVQLPKERVEVRETRPENIIISVDRAGAIYKGREHGMNVYKERVAERTNKDMVKGDLAARYEGIGRIMYACQRAGITKVAFVTEPPPLGG
jgi:biopolymer transport protein ExbD